MNPRDQSATSGDGGVFRTLYGAVFIGAVLAWVALGVLGTIDAPSAGRVMEDVGATLRHAAPRHWWPRIEQQVTALAGPGRRGSGAD